MKYYNFRKNSKEDKPSFKYQEEVTTKITGKLEWVFLNEPKNITTKEGKAVTIPANMNIKLDNEQSLSISIESGSQFRATANSLLADNLNKGDNIEFATYIAKGKYKVISVTNPNKKKTIEWEVDWEKKTAEVNEGYAWKYWKEDYPEVEIITNKKWEFVSADDTEANEYFINKLKEKFFWASNVQSEGSKEEIDINDIPF